jgi:polyphosphate kinase
MEKLKVHSKLIQIQREGSKGDLLVSYIGTGNFHEKTANIYEDMGLLTIDPKIGEEVNRIFNILDGFTNNYKFDTLFVSPFTTRKVFEDLIINEIQNAKKGKEASIRIKLNNLVDSEMIGLLYKAGKAGVKIDMIIRGVCCLIPQKEGLSENIRVRSIVGRYLEHSRYLIFHNDGDRKYFITSADWMERNLDGRIEVGCPIFNVTIQQRIEKIFEIQWKGNVKSRIIDEHQLNIYFRDNNASFMSQEELYSFYKQHSEKRQTGIQII